jgi:hypothetical protein
MLLSELEPHARRALLLGTSSTYAELALTQDGRRLLANPAIAFLDINDVSQKRDPIVAALGRRGLIEEGALLAQSSTNHRRYQRLPETVRNTVLDRIEATIRVCQELGAREVTITHAERDTVARDKSVKAGVQAELTVLPGHVLTGDTTKISSDVTIDGLAIQTSWSFGGTEPDVAAAERALDGSGVYDESLERMIDLFRSPNRPLRHTFAISTESDMRQISDLLAGISVPFVKARAEIENFQRSRSVVRLKLVVDFSDR